MLFTLFFSLQLDLRYCRTERNIPVFYPTLWKTLPEIDPPVACLEYQGRLGNHLFMYAFHYAFAKDRGLSMVRVGDTDLIKVFNIEKHAFLSENEFSASNCEKMPKTEDLYDCGYDESIYTLPYGKSVNFLGYFQSWRYWVRYEEDIRQQFTFRPLILDRASSILNLMLSKREWNFRNDIIVGMHIRRGDYESQKLIEFGQKTAPLRYLTNAMALMKSIFPRIYFLVCSDTIDWAMATIEKSRNIIFVEGNKPEVDMAMLSLTNHSIITAGTYSWWVGFLTNGVTVYYKDIFTRNTSYSAQFRDESVADFFPPTWIGL